MELSVKTEGPLHVVTVRASRIDAAVALDFKDAMRTTAQGAPSTILLDLGQVDFIDSSGLGAIVATMKHLAPERRLILAGLRPTVDRVFRLTRMDSVFRLYPKLSDAMCDLRGGATP